MHKILAWFLVTILLVLSVGYAYAQQGVKWSAPLSEYPTPWVPTTAPPAYHNPQSVQYPYPAYGEAGYSPYGYNHPAGYGYQPPATPSFSGNPYLRHGR